MSDQLAMFEVQRGLGMARIVSAVDRNVVILARDCQPTSARAAERALPRSGSKRARVFEYLQSTYGATDEEIEHALELSGNTVRPTRISLVRDGLVVDSGLVRKTVSGNDAIVWRVK
jgi:hypothetical protein